LIISLSHAREVRHDSWIIDLDRVRPPVLALVGNRRAQSLRAPRAAEAAGAGGRAGYPDEVNNIRVYKHIARSTVLIASAYTSRHHATQASWNGLGSGVLIDDQGSIVTNSHVVDGTAKITVTLHDGKQLPAELVGSDPQTDVALIRVALPKGSAVPAQLGNSDKLEIGQKVLAIGHPFGLGFAFSTGIISGFGKLKDTKQEFFQHSVQTTAPINNPGNSGGPLIDSDGRVIGINATIMMEAQNISFAIPINTVKSIVAELRINGHIIRPWLGVKGKFVTDELRNLIALPLVEGLGGCERYQALLLVNRQATSCTYPYRASEFSCYLSPI